MKRILFFAAVLVISMACTRLQLLAPQGEDGEKGDPGMSAYETWLSLLDKGQYPEWQGRRTEADFLLFLTGKDGKNGRTAYEEWKDMISKGDVEDPHNPGTIWNSGRNTERDFFWFLTGAKGEKGEQGIKGDKGETGAKGDKGDKGATGAKGDKGDKGETGAKGDKGDKGETGAKGDKGDKGETGAKGEKGAKGDKGKKGDPGKDGGVGAQGNPGAPGKPGKDGTNGKNGISAYDVWVEMAKKGNLKNPHPTLPGYEGEFWPKGKVTLEDFWVYLRGEDGKSTKEIISDYVLSFQAIQIKDGGAGYNVHTGDAVLRLTDRNAQPVPAGTPIIFGTEFGLPMQKQYTVGADGTITIPRKDLLPNGTAIDKRVARAKLTINGKEEQTNIFVFPTQVEFKDGGWNIRNDWAPGLVRATTGATYIFDAAGSLAIVELDQRVKELSYSEVYKEWFDAQGEVRKIIFEVTDVNGTVLSPATDDRVKDEWYARSEGDPVARRPLNFTTTADTHKWGHNFDRDAGRVFSNDSYYVRTKAVPKYFGIPGDIQSPIVEIPPMPRIPLIKNIKLSGGKAVGEFEALDPMYMDKIYTDYKESPTNPKLWIPAYTSFKNMVLNILITKVNTAYTGAAKIGEYEFEFPITSTAQDLVGCKVFLSSPSGFTAVTPTSEAVPLNQQPHFRPVLLGTIELDSNGEPRIKYSTDLGVTETHVPLKM